MKRDWIWDGGRISINLVNTMRDRKTGGRELLCEPADLTEWLALANLGDVAASAEQLAEARTLREAIDRVVRDVHPAVDDVEDVNRWARRYYHPPRQLRLDNAGAVQAQHFDPPDPVAAALAAIAVDAIELVLDNNSPLIRICALDTCGLRFVDRSPARNRQWCSMARCGNRAKARQHYARRKSTP